ncbi:uncharacterized protein LOC112601847 [Melanaphis sacchari]|uniref:uncharacterized protein LOC112601847 n=1 Tax=Melanaphis sacchari TaxID=742174 RepID=UPI000DC13DD6|nr:uncharacterized protein LOC112601847 [Melanaphis sacchari]
MSKMGITWFFVLLISFSLCKAEDGTTIKKPINLSMVDSDEYVGLLENSSKSTQEFLMWIKENIQDNIQCTDIGIDSMKCETEGGSNIETTLEVWNRLPSSIRDQWDITTISNNSQDIINFTTD